MSVASPLGTVGILVRYWVKGRFTKATILGLVIGEAFSVIFILFGSSTYLSFSNRVGLTTGLSEVAGSLVLALYLVGLIQSGFNGGGLPVSASDVDYVFTSPVPPRESSQPRSCSTPSRLCFSGFLQLSSSTCDSQHTIT